MKNVIIYLSFVITVMVLYGFAFADSNKGDDPAGKKIFVDTKCNMCHTVTSAGIESKKSDAKDLSNVGSEQNIEFFTKYLKKEVKLNDKDHKFAFKGSDEDFKKLVDWLASLKVEETK